MAEAAVAADPLRPGHLAAAADPYLETVRILVTRSNDAGATWAPPLTILPPGFAKSYDPVLGFDTAGDLLVVGGAAQLGARGCQPASVIFLATVNATGVGYRLLRDTRADGAYADRPELAVDRSTPGRAFVTWTESAGPGAECRATPDRSKIMLARIGDGGLLRDVRPLAAAQLEAPFGAAVVLGTDGTVKVAVGDHGGGRSRLMFLRSTDDGATWSTAVTVDEGPEPPLQVPGVGGVVAAVPSLATTSDRVAVAWNKGAASGPEMAVFELRTGGAWAPLGSPSPAGSLDLLPSVTYDRSGRLWLLAAAVVGSSLDYRLQAWSGRWEPAVSLGSGTASGLAELGESLGITDTDGGLLAAFPLDGPSASSLTLSHVATSPATAPSHRSAPPTGSASGQSTPSRSSPIGASAVLAAVALSAAVAAAAASRRRRRRKARRGLPRGTTLV